MSDENNAREGNQTPQNGGDEEQEQQNNSEEHQDGDGDGEETDKERAERLERELEAERTTNRRKQKRRANARKRAQGDDNQRSNSNAGDGQDGQDTESQEKESFEPGEEALLIAKGIDHEDDQDFILEVMNETGKTLREVVNSRNVQGELKSMKEEREAQAASPSGSTRSRTPSQDSVDYWIGKGELPPKETHPELRRKVVREKRKRAKTTKKFAS